MSSLTAPSSVPLPMKTSKPNFLVYGTVVFGLVFGPAMLAALVTLARMH